MNRMITGLGPILLALGLSGCGAGIRGLQSTQTYLIAAQPLCETTPDNVQDSSGKCVPVPPNAPVMPTKEFLGQVVTESETSCTRFLTQLTAASDAANTDLDILSAIFGALGTLFTPTGTIHLFTAATSITSGTKAAVANDVLAKATIANHAQAIQSTYFKDIKQYMSDLDKADAAALIRSNEIGKIQSYHAECGLGPAQSAIASTIRTDNTPTGGTGTGAGAGTPPPPAPASRNAPNVTTAVIPGRAIR